MLEEVKARGHCSTFTGCMPHVRSKFVWAHFVCVGKIPFWAHVMVVQYGGQRLDGCHSCVYKAMVQ